jgi:hypothetical protein
MMLKFHFKNFQKEEISKIHLREYKFSKSAHSIIFFRNTNSVNPGNSHFFKKKRTNQILIKHST